MPEREQGVRHAEPPCGSHDSLDAAPHPTIIAGAHRVRPVQHVGPAQAQAAPACEVQDVLNLPGQASPVPEVHEEHAP